MTLYCFRCVECGDTAELWEHGLTPKCHGPMVRDYRAESVGIGSGVRVSRDGTVRDQAELFLPNNQDFAGPGDPDGRKGMRDWRDSHTPKADNGRPHWPGEVEKKTFALS